MRPDDDKRYLLSLGIEMFFVCVLLVLPVIVSLKQANFRFVNRNIVLYIDN